MDNILTLLLDKVNPLDRSYKILIFCGLILTVTPPAYIFIEEGKLSDRRIEIQGNQKVLEQKQKTAIKNLDLNIDIIKSIKTRDFTYEEYHKRFDPLFKESKDHKKEIELIELELLKVDTDSRRLESKIDTLNRVKWPMLCFFMIGPLMAVLGYLNWSSAEYNELRLASASPKMRAKR